jgi:hypothetical protein
VQRKAFFYGSEGCDAQNEHGFENGTASCIMENVDYGWGV